MPNSPKKPDMFATIHGPNGDFEMAQRPRGREAPWYTYVYRDSAHQFTFEGGPGVKKIGYALNARRLGDFRSPVQLNEDEEKTIKESIICFFQTRHPFLIDREVEPSIYVGTVEFSLGVVR
jgi:hypothetical protein